MNTVDLIRQFDATGQSSANHIKDERHTLSAHVAGKNRFIVPTLAPYFTFNVDVYKVDPSTGKRTKLTKYEDWIPGLPYKEVTESLEKEVCGCISITDSSIVGTISVDYNTIGGDFTLDEAGILSVLANILENPITIDWSEVADVPDKFPVEMHYHTADQLAEYQLLVNAVIANTNALKNAYTNAISVISRHLKDVNPHGITATSLKLNHLLNTTLATDEDIGNQNNDHALVTAANIAALRKIIKEQDIGDVSTIITDVNRNVDELGKSLDKVKNYGVADSDEKLTRDATELYTRVSDVFKIVEMYAADATAANDTTNTSKFMTPALTHNIIDNYVPIGSMMLLPKTVLKSGRYLIPNGGTFNKATYPELYNYLGTNVLPNVAGCDLRTYDPANPESIGTKITDSVTTTKSAGILLEAYHSESGNCYLRRYSDGWIEQGGRLEFNHKNWGSKRHQYDGSLKIAFMEEMGSTDYYPTIAIDGNINYPYPGFFYFINNQSFATTSFIYSYQSTYDVDGRKVPFMNWSVRGLGSGNILYDFKESDKLYSSDSSSSNTNATVHTNLVLVMRVK